MRTRGQLATALSGFVLAASMSAQSLQPAPSGPAVTPRETTASIAETPHAIPRLICQSTALVPGQIVNVGVSFRIEPHWHLYWKGISDTGMPIQIKPDQLPTGYRWLEPIWPAPTRHLPAEDLLDHIYEGQVTVILPLQVPAEARPGTSVTLRLHLDWLVCREACILETADVEVSLPVVLTASPSPEAAFFAQTLARAGVPVPSGRAAAEPVDVAWADPAAPTLSVPGAAALEFYPLPDSSRPTNLLVDGRVVGSTLRLRIEPEREPGPARVSGLLMAESRRTAGSADTSIAYYWVNSTGPTTVRQPPDQTGQAEPSLP